MSHKIYCLFVFFVGFFLCVFDAEAQVDLTMRLGPAQSNPFIATADGNPVTASFELSNIGMTDSTGAGIEFMIAPQLDPADVIIPPPGWNCNTTTGEINCDLTGTIAVGEVAVFEVTTSGATGPIEIPTGVVATVFDSGGTDADPGNDSVGLDYQFVAAGSSVDLSLVKTVVGNTNVTVGESIIFQIEVDNLDNVNAATNVLIADNLSVNNLEFDQAASSPECTDTGNSIECSLANLAPLTGAAFTIATTVTDLTPFGNRVNEATVNSDQIDVDTSNNLASAGFNVLPPPPPVDVSVTKSIQGDPLTADQGSQLIYLVDISNNDSVSNAEPGFILSDTLPAGVSYVSHTVVGVNFTCSENAGTIECQNAVPFPPLSTDQLQVTVLVNGAVNDVVTNTAQLDVAPNDTNTLNNTDSVDFTITAGILPDLQLSKTIIGGGSNFPQGAEVGYFIQAENIVAATTLPNLTFTDTLPAGVTYNRHEEVGTSFNCTFAAPTLTCTAASLAADPNPQGVNLFVDVTGAANATVSNTAGSTVVDADTSNNFDTVDFLITANAITSDLNVNITSAGTGTISVGDREEFVVNFSNTGTDDVNAVFVESTLPAGVGFEEFTSQPGDVNCNYSPANGRILCVSAQLLAGDSREIAFRVRPQQAGSYPISVTVDSTDAGFVDSNPGNNTRTRTLLVGASSGAVDVQMVKTASASTVLPGASFSYFLDVSNIGLQPASNVRLADDLPAGVVFSSIDAPGWNCNDSTELRCSFAGTLASGASSRVTINVEAPSTNTSLINQATVDAQNEANAINNTDQVVVAVNGTGTGFVDLQVDKTASVSQVNSGETISWEIVFENRGDSTATFVTLEDRLPDGFNPVSFSNTGMLICSMNGKTIRCVADSVPANQQDRITIVGTAEIAQGTLTNQVTVSSNEVDANPDNNNAGASVNVMPTIRTTADVGVQITGLVETARQGSVIDLTFNTLNNGPQQATDVELEVSFTGLIDEINPISAGNYDCSAANRQLLCRFQGDFPANQTEVVQLQIITEQVVQVAENISIQAQIRTTSIDTNTENNADSKGADIEPTPDEETILRIFNEAVGSSARQQTLRAIKNVASYCARSYFKALDNLCDRVLVEAQRGNGTLIRRFMREVTPDEVIGQSSSATEIANSQLTNVSSRLAEIRSGGGSGISIAGLNARYGDQNMPLSLLSYLNQTEDEARATGTDRDFISPWGFFINGTISMGERDETQRELGFDFDTYGLTAGLDYRLNAKSVIGMALGYAKFDSEIENQAKLESEGLTLTGYGSFNLTDRFYMDARISYGQPEFDQRRRIEFSIGDNDINRVARSSTDADQYTAAFSFGYQFNKNAWAITPNATIQYTQTNIDGFAESGAGDFDFIFEEQDIESLLFSAGLRVSRAFSLSQGVLTPQFDLNYSRETQNDNEFIRARFAMAPEDEIFLIETDNPDKTYGSVGLGLVFVSANGKQLYLNYRETIGLSGFSQGTINLGGRFEF